ncbi:MAG: hypothetical protein WB424_16675, partial [Terracidiphilus sp.]
IWAAMACVSQPSLIRRLRGGCYANGQHCHNQKFNAENFLRPNHHRSRIFILIYYPTSQMHKGPNDCKVSRKKKRTCGLPQVLFAILAGTASRL